MSLNLGSSTSASITVRYNGDDIQFARTVSNPVWHPKPIKWSPTGNTALTITWTLGTDVRSVQPDSGSGITVNSDGTWTVPVPSGDQSDGFTVTKDDGSTVDPKIVITPQ